MPLITALFGLLLIAMGIVGYEMSDRVSMTALIPSFAGIPWLLLGVWAIFKKSACKMAMHLAAGLSLLLVVVSIGGAVSMDRPKAQQSLAVMAVLAVIHLILCVRSFIRVRREKKVEG